MIELIIRGMIMLGYIEAEKPELRLREFAIYNGWYCGLCKQAGRDYGQLLRLGLSYDMAFLGLFLGALEEGPETIRQEHCIAHPVRKKNVVYDPVLAYAADMMALLGWENYLDDRKDRDTDRDPLSERLLKTASAPGLRRAYQKARGNHPETAAGIREALEALGTLEEQNCSRPDLPAESFAKVMQTVFDGRLRQTGADANVRRIVSEFSSHLGRWIYLLDAADDLEKDRSSGAYNPLLAAADGGQDEVLIREEIRPVLYHHLGRMTDAYELLDIRKNRELLNNILYLGLRRKTDQVLDPSYSDRKNDIAQRKAEQNDIERSI